ncbi:hypothetical protein Taro_040545 [Colocasia esculenta]|uniref:Uncharacterized protein n=1 Tax=Colocasia esculenta TaxID=4460 RepID=A0A843W991_COLES|nr:hypothetical protein [Colocasia esculenta]
MHKPLVVISSLITRTHAQQRQPSSFGVRVAVRPAQATPMLTAHIPIPSRKIEATPWSPHPFGRLKGEE